MATLTVVLHKRWWVSPLLFVLKVFVYARIVKEKHFKSLSGFIARWGFKFKTEK